MNDKLADPRDAQEAARRHRLAKALRDNLKRRKSQSRGRADAPAGATDADPDRPGRTSADGES